MTQKLILPSLALLLLAACGPSREEQAAKAEAEKIAEEEANLPPPPPPITSEGTYRCADNTILYIDFYGEDEGASVRIGDKTATPVRLSVPAPAAGEAAPAADAPKPPLKSEDGSTVLAGSGNSINITLPGKGAQTCKK